LLEEAVQVRRAKTRPIDPKFKPRAAMAATTQVVSKTLRSSRLDQRSRVCSTLRGELARQVFVSGEIRLDPPGIAVTIEEIYAD
jgi:hypothetical protein